MISTNPGPESPLRKPVPSRTKQASLQEEDRIGKRVRTRIVEMGRNRITSLSDRDTPSFRSRVS